VGRALYSMMVCVIVMLAVPISQLQLVSQRIECCCPDPNNCHCPDHGKQGPEQDTIKSCHKSSTTLASAEAPVASEPVEVLLAAPALHVTTAHFIVTQPHVPPSPERPRGPS
jgi:hypothetical protein